MHQGVKMFRIQVHKFIRGITLGFYLLGFWHRGDVETHSEWRLKIFYSVYHLLFPISVIVGAIGSDDNDEKVFLIEVAIIGAVLVVKLWYIIWRKRETLELLDRICDYNVEDRETFDLVNNKLKKFMKFCAAFLGTVLMSGICVSFFVPFFSTDRKLFINFGFPFDWRNNEVAYWLAHLFFVTQVTIAALTTSFSVIVWYLMANCGWNYEVVGQQIKEIGEIDESSHKNRISKSQIDTLYQYHLIEAIRSHSDLKEYFYIIMK